MHILVIRFSSLGDVVLQTSMLSWMKMNYPACKITFLTAKEFTPLIQDHPHVDQVVGMPRFKGLKGVLELKRFIRKLDMESQFDLILDLHATTRSFFVKLFMPFVKNISIDKRRFERWLLVKTKIDLLKNERSIHSRHHYDLSHILSYGFNETKLINFINKDSKKDLKLTSLPLSFIEDAPKISGSYVVISPVASFNPKRWPEQYFYKLAQDFLEINDYKEFKVIVLAGPDDHFCNIFNPLEKKYPGRFYNLQGKTTLKESMEYLKDCSLCVGNDTGLNHIAEAFGNPVITIFGPTHESLGFKAHLEYSKNISLDLKCRPCSTTGKKACKFKDQICMTHILAENILENMTEILRVRNV